MGNLLNIEYPPAHLYQPAIHSQVYDTPQYVPILLRVEYPISGGIFRVLQGFHYLQKTFPTPEAVWCNNVVKKQIKAYFNLLSTPKILFAAIPFVFYSWKKKVEVLGKSLDQVSVPMEYVYSCYPGFPSFILLKKHFCPVARELGSFAYRFLSSLGIPEEVCRRWENIISCVMEYDNAYRFRLEDIFSITTLEKLSHPPEITRLAGILKEREGEAPDVAIKFGRVARLIRLALYHPNIRKAWKQTLQDTNLTNLHYDDADLEWVTVDNGNYRFLGLSGEDRRSLFLRAHGNQMPPLKLMHATLEIKEPTLPPILKGLQRLK